MALSMKASVAARAAGRSTMGRRVANVSNGSRVVMKAATWLPGTDAPAWLEEDIPGNFGFDPLGLGKDKDALFNFRVAEVYHCRWAMLGVAGCLAPEALGLGDWVQAQEWVVAGAKPTYLGITPPHDLPIMAVVGVMLGLFAVERAMFLEAEGEKRLYPGFDFAGLAKDAKAADKLRWNELRNGRLAMVAFAGFVGQHAATGKGPLAALGEHVAHPLTANFATNGVSVPFF